MYNCLSINVQRVNRSKIEEFNVIFNDLGPPEQFVRHCRMRVKVTSEAGSVRQSTKYCVESY